MTMWWKVYIFIIFLFYYTSNGQIVLVPSANLTSNPNKLLSEKIEKEGPIKTLKAKRPGNINPLPSQWALGPEGTPRWPNAVIKYYVDKNSYGVGISRRLSAIMFSIMRGNFPCPKFMELSEKPTGSDGSWLHFTNPDRVRPCLHEPGLDNNGEIKIVLGYDCLEPRQIVHTVLHGLGFRDEVTHPQRDLFVRVMWENIQPAFRSMFRIQSVETNDASLMEYDPKSVMHFHDRAYSLNGQATIMPMLPGLTIEPSGKLSHLDNMKIQKMFSHECKKSLVGKVIKSGCAAWHDQLRDDRLNQYGNNGNGCPNYDNGGNQIVIPGNDVKLEDGDNSVEDVVPGQNAKAGDEGDTQIVVPGNDVKVDDDQMGSGNDVDQIVVPGRDVKLNGDQKGSDINDYGKVLKLSAEVNMIPNQEAIVVGYE